MDDLSGKTVLIMASDGFEEVELTGPRDELSKAGARIVIASPDLTPIQARVADEPTIKVQPDIRIDDVDEVEYDALILPGGVINPDHLRTNETAVGLIRDFYTAGKPVAAICHGPWLLVEADIIRGKTVTSWPSIRTDLRNAGGEVVDESVAVDGNLITSRQPEDVPDFNAAIASALTS